MVQIIVDTFHLSNINYDLKIHSLHKGKDAGPFQQFQGARLSQKLSGGGAHKTFMTMQKFHKLPENLANSIEECDSFLRLPSDHEWQAEPYYEAIKARFKNAHDLSVRLTRNSSARSHRNGTTFAQVQSAYQYTAGNDEPQFRSLVLIDDTFQTGNTMSAVIASLKQNNLSDECKIILACPLWIAS